VPSDLICRFAKEPGCTPASVDVWRWHFWPFQGCLLPQDMKIGRFALKKLRT
jgi:hypothetical protein